MKLVKPGEVDIVGDPVAVKNDGWTINTTFDLTGRTRGLWDVVIADPEGSTITIPGGFSIEEGQGAKIWADIFGYPLIRPGRPQTYHVFYGNTGNVDGVAYLALRGIPKGATVRTNFGRVVNSSSNDLRVNGTSAEVIDYDDERKIPVDIRNIRPGTTGVISLEITVSTGVPFALQPMVMAP